MAGTKLQMANVSFRDIAAFQRTRRFGFIECPLAGCETEMPEDRFGSSSVIQVGGHQLLLCA